MKKILLYGNYTFENRGDLAILHGLYEAIKRTGVDWELTISSDFAHYADEVFPGIKLIPNEVAEVFSKPNESLLSKMNYNYLDSWRLDALAKRASKGDKMPFFPKRFKGAKTFLEPFDAVIFVGGSYFIDIYGSFRFLALALSIYLSKPSYLAGHSIGPFSANGRVKRLAKTLFPKLNAIYIRDEASIEYADELGLDASKYKLKADTAWLIPEAVFSTRVLNILSSITKPIVAITVRDVAAFAERLGIKQGNLEHNYAELLDDLIEKGYFIIAVSMGVPAKDSTYTDDRVSANKIRLKLKKPNSMLVIESALNHLEIGAILSKCQLLVGTRLHSVILAMRYGTPAIAVYYEHKSLGTLRKMGLEDYSCMIAEINEKKTRDQIDFILENNQEVSKRISTTVQKEQTFAKEMVQEIVNAINQR